MTVSIPTDADIASLAERLRELAETPMRETRPAGYKAYPEYLPQPRHLAALCDSLKAQITRMEDQIADQQRQLDTWREILQALGWLKDQPPPPLYTAGAEQEEDD